MPRRSKGLRHKQRSPFLTIFWKSTIINFIYVEMGLVIIDRQGFSGSEASPWFHGLFSILTALNKVQFHAVFGLKPFSVKSTLLLLKVITLRVVPPMITAYLTTV